MRSSARLRNRSPTGALRGYPCLIPRTSCGLRANPCSVQGRARIRLQRVVRDRDLLGRRHVRERVSGSSASWSTSTWRRTSASVARSPAPGGRDPSSIAARCARAPRRPRRLRDHEREPVDGGATALRRPASGRQHRARHGLGSPGHHHGRADGGARRPRERARHGRHPDAPRRQAMRAPRKPQRPPGARRRRPDLGPPGGRLVAHRTAAETNHAEIVGHITGMKTRPGPIHKTATGGCPTRPI